LVAAIGFAALVAVWLLVYAAPSSIWRAQWIEIGATRVSSTERAERCWRFKRDVGSRIGADTVAKDYVG
jgi:hypothetical protein